jgi:hypothetical protein
MENYFLFFLKILITANIYYIIGNVINKCIKINSDNFYLITINGIIYTGFITLLINFFLPLSLTLNSTIAVLFTIIFFLLKKNTIAFKKNYKKFFFPTFLTFIFLIHTKEFEPDNSLYHLPITFNLINEKIIFGLTNIHSRLGLSSILQYLNAFNVNYINNVDGLIFATPIFLSYFISLLVNEIKKKFSEKKNIEYFFLLSILFIISIRFNRYNGFGNDALANITFFLIIYTILLKEKIIEIFKDNKLNILIVFLVLQKIFFLFLLLIPFFNLILLCFVKKKSNKFRLNFFLDSRFFCLIFLILWMIKNLFISGCFFYPIHITCLKAVEWNSENSHRSSPKILTLEGEAWAKNWNKYEGDLKMSEYVNRGNWFPTWKSDHLNIVKSKLIVIIAASFLLFIINIIISKNKIFNNLIANFKNVFSNSKYLSIFLISSLGTILWFIKFPIFRYGSSFVLTVLILFTLPFILNLKISKKLNSIIIVFIISIILLKNTFRIIQDFSLNKQLVNRIKLSNFYERKINNQSFYFHDYACGFNKTLCTSYSDQLDQITFKNYFNYKVIIIKQ